MNLPTNPGSSLAVLAREKLERYRSKGAFGKPAYQNHVQLKAMLRSKHGDLYANYFAKPSFDPDTGDLSWIADVPGTARRWSDIPVEEQGKLALQLEMVRSRLLAYIDELRTQAGGKTGTASSHATLLEQAMQAPAEQFLFFVDKQPIVAFWGFEDEKGRSIDPSQLAPRYGAGLSGATDVALPHAGAGGDDRLQPMPSMLEDGSRKKRPWWWRLWWLWLLLLLMLLALLLMRGCASDGRFAAERAIKGASVDEPRDSPRTPGESSVVPGQQGSFGPGGPGGPSGPGGPGSSAPGQGIDGVPPGPDAAPGTDPNADLGSTPEKPPVPNPEQPNDPGKPIDPNKPTDPGAPNESLSPPNAPAKPDDPNRPNEPSPGQQQPKEDGVKIPPNPQDSRKMEFLQGDWKAGSNLADKETNQPLDLSVKFGEGGKGEITLRRKDGSVCKGPVQGSMAGSKLTIDGAQSIPCSNGGTFAPPRIECTARPDGTAPCVGVNRADGQRYGLGMRRQ